MAKFKTRSPVKFKIKKRVSEEDKIKRRAIVFGFLTILLAILFIVWGVPLFVKLVGVIGDIKSEKENINIGDTIPPVAPRLSYIPEATNSAVIPITGFTEPGAKVIISFNQEEIETFADEEGNFSLEKLSLSQGLNKIIVWAEDDAENQSEQTKLLEIIYDTTAPELVIESPQDKTSTEELVADVKGKTEPSARVLVNDHIVILDEEGNFSDKVTLQEGRNQIRIVCQDRAGNETIEERSITYLP